MVDVVTMVRDANLNEELHFHCRFDIAYSSGIHRVERIDPGGRRSSAEWQEDHRDVVFPSTSIASLVAYHHLL